MSDLAPAIPVSVVIPAYNAAAHLARTFTSIAAQRVRPAEVIVIDDGSTDDTAATAAAFGARVFSTLANRGPAAARNTGVRIARNDWVAFLDADDTWHPEKLERQWAAISRWPDAAFAFTDYDVVQAGGARVEREGSAHPGYARMVPLERCGDDAFFDSRTAVGGLIRSMFVRQSSVIVNRARFQLDGGYDERLRLGEDYDLFLRLSANAPIVSTERALVVYHRREESLSADPLAEIRAIDAQWASMLERPGAYPAAMLERIRAERLPTLRRGIVRSIRLGRFGDAAAFAASAYALAPSRETATWRNVARLAGGPAGRSVHRAARALWRARQNAGSST